MICYRDGDPWRTCDGCFQPREKLTWQQVENLPVEMQAWTCSEACAKHEREHRAKPVEEPHLVQ